jgi:hypothetical protein
LSAVAFSTNAREMVMVTLAWAFPPELYPRSDTALVGVVKLCLVERRRNNLLLWI